MIIGLSGYAQTGKDSIAEILVREYGFKRLAFADLLRSCLYALNPIVNVIVYEDETGQREDTVGLVFLAALVDGLGWDEAKQLPEVRRLLQLLGTEVVREQLGQNTWVNAAMAQIEPGKDYVFTDVRFPNEFDAIITAPHQQKGYNVRVHRTGVLAVNAHASETALDGFPFDAEIDNNHDIPWLEHLVGELVDNLKGNR